MPIGEGSYFSCFICWTTWECSICTNINEVHLFVRFSNKLLVYAVLVFIAFTSHISTTLFSLYSHLVLVTFLWQVNVPVFKSILNARFWQIFEVYAFFFLLKILNDIFYCNFLFYIKKCKDMSKKCNLTAFLIKMIKILLTLCTGCI